MAIDRADSAPRGIKIVELYCSHCGANLPHERRKFGIGRLVFTIVTFGLTLATFYAARDRCTRCHKRRAARPALPPPPVLTADEVESRRYTCRVCKRVNSILEIECLQCAAPRPRQPA